MQTLSETEQKEAIALIANMPFDVDVISAIRGLLRKKAQDKREWRQMFNDLYAATTDTLEDTQPYRVLEFDGD